MEKYVVKYGILYKPTGEYVSWFDDRVDVIKLFDKDRNIIEKQLDLISDNDYVIDTITLPVNFDGASIADDQHVFVDAKTIFKFM